MDLLYRRVVVRRQRKRVLWGKGMRLSTPLILVLIGVVCLILCIMLDAKIMQEYRAN